MRYTFFFLFLTTLCLLPNSLFCVSSEQDGHGAMVSIRILQKLDLRGAFEAVYTIAMEQGTLDRLPRSFFNCLASLREGSDRVQCGEFIEALKLVLETLVVLRDFERRYTTCQKACCCEERFRRLEEDILEVFVDFGDRIANLEKICGVLAAKE